MRTPVDPEAIRNKVREGYGHIAQQTGSGCGPAVSCCGSAPPEAEKLAQSIGYSAEELAALPDGANMGLSCGNPNALAALQPGGGVLDLGSGGGFDVSIAGKKVGADGLAIGVDLTADMLAKARKNIETYRQTSGLNNVEFRLGEIEHLPVADSSVDAIISNCVINLSPDKPQVWREIARVLKPGGRVAVSDLALLRPLPPEVREMVDALVGCVAGAALVTETERMARDAGFVRLELERHDRELAAMTEGEDELHRRIATLLPAGARLGDYVTSLAVRGLKPRS